MNSAAPRQMSALQGIVFDVDGTLVDSNYVHVRCWREALFQAGHDIPSFRIHHAIGKPSGKLLAALLGPNHDTATDADLIAAHETLYGQQQRDVRRLPGARALLFECARRGLAVALASSASQREATALRRAIDADSAIAVMTTADDVASGKPDPDPITVALREISVDPANAIFVGDSVWDALAAQRVPIRFVGVSTGGTSVHDLRASGAEDVYDGPWALREDLSRLVVRGGS